MNTKTIVAILLIVLGVIAFVYQGITYTSMSEGIDIGPMHMAVEETHRIPISPIVGAIALVVGIGLLVAGRKGSGRAAA